MSQALAVPSLMKWGVSPHADLVYRTLIAFGPGSIHHISQSLEMRARQVRAALDELISLGAAAPADSSAGDDRTWTSHAPAQVVPLLRERHQRSALERHRLHLRMMNMAHPSVIGDPSRLPRDQVRQHDGIERTREQMFAMMATLRHEHMSMNPEPSFGTVQLQASARHSRKMTTNGVAIRILGVPASPDDESDWSEAEERSRGSQYRELPTLPAKLFIMDRQTAWVPINPANLVQGYWEISAPQTVRDLTALFHQQWGIAKVPRRDWIPPMHLSPRESAIVVLLAAGHTDAAIAAKLDISVRTIAYTLSSLMERYQVTNRFQLGLRLGAESAHQVTEDETTSTEEPPGDSPKQE
jgi:DNA-binding CsgD family transcriptional regulator